MKFLIILLIFSLNNFNNVLSETASCKYETKNNDYSCTLSLSNKNSIADEITQINGNHIEDKTDRDVKSVYQDFEFKSSTFPSMICSKFRYLRTIEWFWGELENIYENSLENCKNLEELQINANKIEKLPENAFFHQSKLEFLDLSDNKIEELPQNIFTPLVKLEILLLNGNKLKIIHSDSFGQNTKLRELKFHNNQLKSFDEKIIDDNKMLKLVEVAPNPCSERKGAINDNSKSRSLIKTAMKKCFENYQQNNMNERQNKNSNVEISESLNDKRIENLAKEFRDEINALKNKHAELNDVVQKLQNNQTEMKVKIENLTIENDKMKKQIEELKIENQNFEATKIQINKKYQEIHSFFKILKAHFLKISNYDTVYNQLMTSNRQLTAEYKTITDQTTQLTLEFDTLKSQIDNFIVDMKEVREKHIKLSNEVDFIVYNKIRNIWKEINDLKKVDDEYATENIFTNLAIQNLNTTNEEMKVETRTMNHEFKDLKLKNYDLKEKIQKIQEKIQSVENQMKIPVVNSDQPKTDPESSQKIEKLDKTVEFLLLQIIDLKKCCPKVNTSEN